jgi:PAS domain S-box-containing protein
VLKKPSYEELEQRVKELEAALGDSELERTTILDLQPYHGVIQSMDNRIIWANRAAFESVGVSREDLIGRYCYEIWPQRTCPCPDCPVIKSVQTGKSQSIEKTTPDGRKWHIRGYPIRNNRGQITRALELTEEITERKQIEEALRKSEERYRNIFKNIQDVYYEVTLDGIILEISPSIEDESLYNREEIIGKSLSDIYVDPKNRDEFLKELLNKGKVTDYEALMLDKDGSQVYCSITAKLVRDKQGNPVKIIGSLHNITNQKRAEEHINILTRELMKTQENERQRISYYLHDNMAQKLSALIIDCEMFLDNQPSICPEISKKVTEMSKTLRECIKEVRDLAYYLRPSVLDEMGLVQALFQYCNDFSENNGITVDFHSAGMKDLQLDFDTEINLYRLVQEGLTNVKKHADADHVTIKLVAAFPDIILRIEDNGKGFNVQKRMATLTKEKRMGIHSMEQRAKLLQGEMEIQSRRTQGTNISIRLPYKDNNSGSNENHIDNRRPSP